MTLTYILPQFKGFQQLLSISAFHVQALSSENAYFVWSFVVFQEQDEMSGELSEKPNGFGCRFEHVSLNQSAQTAPTIHSHYKQTLCVVFTLRAGDGRVCLAEWTSFLLLSHGMISKPFVCVFWTIITYTTQQWPQPFH